MAKLTLSDVTNIGGNPTSASSTLNANAALIETALENTLSRDGTSPNEMNADLDMNSNRILNLPEPLTDLEPLRLIDLQGIEIDASQVTCTPFETIAATNVQDALEEIFAEGGGGGGAGLVDGDYGDITVSGTGTVMTIDTVNANVGTFGSATVAPSVTVNAKGQVTAVTTNTVTPAVGSITGLGTGVATFLATPSSANLASALTDETGSGANVFATSPTLVTPILGTPTSGTLTNCTGLPISTGVSGLAAGIATFLATPSSANLISAVTNETGTGSLVFATSPTLVTPLLGTPTSGTLTNCTGLPISTGVSGLGANVATFLATPSSANLASAITDETGSGVVVFGTSPSFTTSMLLSSGFVMNWNASDVTLTHSADTLTMAGGTLVLPASGLQVGSSNPFSDSAGTLTLQNVDALDATTESTIEAAMDTLANVTSIQGRTVTLADAGFDVLLGWDDSGSAYKNFALADIGTEAAPAAGDFILIYGAEGDLRKVDWSGLPGAGGGISNVVEDLTPQLGGDLDGLGNDITNIASLGVTSTAAGTLVSIVSTDAGATAGPTIDLFRNSASPANSDILGQINFSGKDNAAGTTNFAAIDCSITDITDTSEDGRLNFRTMVAGTLTNQIKLDTVLSPVANDGVALGTTSLGWSDLHLADGGVINWANSSARITHSSAASARRLTIDTPVSEDQIAIGLTGNHTYSTAVTGYGILNQTGATFSAGSSGAVFLQNYNQCLFDVQSGVTASAVYSYQVQLGTKGAAPSGTLTEATGFLVNALTGQHSGSAAMTISTVNGLNIADQSSVVGGSGTVTVSNSYALRINNQGTGATNYAIFTGIGHNQLGDDLLITKGDAATNTVTNVLTLQHTTSGTAAASFGVGMAFEAENASGTTRRGGTMDLVTTDATNATEDFDFSWKLMTAGAAAAEKMKLSGADGGLTVNSGIVQAPYICRLEADYTLTSNTNLQKLFNSTANGALTLPAGSYIFDACIGVTAMSATSGNAAFSILGAGTATLGNILQTVTGVDIAAGTGGSGSGSWSQTADMPAANTNVVTASSQTAMFIQWKGSFKVTAGGTIIPSIDMITASAAIVESGSYFAVYRMGDATTATVGPWS